MNGRRIIHVLVSAGLALALALGAPVAPSAADGPGVIAVWIEQNCVGGFHWPVGTELTLTVDDPATPEDIDYQDTQIVEVETGPYDPGSTKASFCPGEAFTIQPGHIVTLSGGGTTRTHTVTNLTLDGADMVGDRLWGTADPGSVVEVRHMTQRDIVRYETANVAGSWLADFSVVGDEPEEALIHDFNEDTELMVMQSNGGGHTQIDWRMPRPGFVAQLTQNQVSMWDWPLGFPVTLSIDDPGNGPGTDYSTTFDPAPCEWSEGTCFWKDLGDEFRVRAGHLVTLTNGFITQAHTVSAVQVTDIDSDADTVSGTAEPGAKVHVQMQYLRGNIQRHVTADGVGDWMADFSVPGNGDDEQLTIDLIPWHEGTAAVRDNYGGGTEVTWPVNMQVNVSRQIRANNWYYGDEVTLAIDDPATPAAPDFTDSAFPMVGPWAYTGLEFDIGQTFRTQPGHIASLTQTGRSKTCVVSPIAITGVNYITDIVTGVSNANAQVQVSVPVGSGDEWARYRYAQADASGHWTVDFSQPGTYIVRHPNEIEIVDIVPTMSVRAEEGDENACFTAVSVYIPYPTIGAYLPDNLIAGFDFLLGGVVTLTINDPETSDEVDYSATQTPTPQYWNPLFGRALFELGDGFALRPGLVITMSDVSITKTHTVTVLQMTGVDYFANQVYGTAAPGTELTVVARSETVRAQRDLVAAPDGSWLADFSMPGPTPGEQDTIELETAYNIAAYQSDEDSDTTHVNWVENQPPEIDAIVGPDAPVMMNTAVQVSASFSDPDAGDTHTAVWNWGDGTTSDGIVDEEGGMVSGSHTYTAAGVYALGLILCDVAGECDQAQYQYLVVYDPAGGFVTGGGWIGSAQSYCHLDAACEAAEGKASFGFVSKYKKGASVPDGNTEFQFQAGNLNFHSTSYQWLVVNRTGTNAQFKGYGTINDAGNYGFMLWAGDGSPDTFRIKIWVANDETNVVYDNGVAQPIGSGSIVVHK